MKTFLCTLTTFLICTQLFAATALPDNRYIVRMIDGISQEEIYEFFDTLEIKVVKIIPALSLYVGTSSSRLNLDEINDNQRGRVKYIEKDHIVKAVLIPNDEKYKKKQKNIRRLNVEKAWDISTGSHDVVVAVSDTGLSATNPDIKNNVWVNLNEIPGNKIDDDKNGRVDDVSGWNYWSNKNSPRDDNGHGTHVSGIIGGEGNNGVGMAGINWHIQILPLKFLNHEGSGYTDAAIEGIIDAADFGVRILNASWGGGGYSQALMDTIEYAYQRGMLIMAAAGNDGSNNDFGDHYPSDYDHMGILSVASSDKAGRLSNFSNMGLTSVDVVAPGSGIYSTIGGRWGYMSGTSMASPMVAGVAALMLSVDPNLTVDQLRNGLINAADLRDKYYKRNITSGGDLNAQKALLQLQDGFQLWPQRVSILSGSRYNFTTYKAEGEVTWHLSREDLGTIDQDGVFTSIEGMEGKLTIFATDATGTTLSTNAAQVVIPKRGGGCTKEAKAADGDNSSSPFSAVPYLIMLGSVALFFRMRSVLRK